MFGKIVFLKVLEKLENKKYKRFSVILKLEFEVKN